MRFCVLGSGSKGNCTYVTSNNSAILIDAGFSGIEIERRLASIDVDITEIDAILVTHEHGDHARGVSVLSRRFQLPVFANLQTMQSSEKYFSKLHSFEQFATGTSFLLGDLKIHPFSISHDSAEPVGYTVSNGQNAFGYCTDTGMVSKLIQHRLSLCQGLVLECNHDLEMLKNGPYPIQVQQRVRSKTGHLAIPQTIEFLKDLYHAGLQKVVLAHISESNNSFELIQQSIDSLFTDLQDRAEENQIMFSVSLAAQDRVGDMVLLEDSSC